MRGQDDRVQQICLRCVSKARAKLSQLAKDIVTLQTGPNEADAGERARCQLGAGCGWPQQEAGCGFASGPKARAVESD